MKLFDKLKLVWLLWRELEAIRKGKDMSFSWLLSLKSGLKAFGLTVAGELVYAFVSVVSNPEVVKTAFADAPSVIVTGVLIPLFVALAGVVNNFWKNVKPPQK